MLIFPLKKEWYEKIKSGEKTIEYREVKPYWTKRFWHEGGSLTFNTISYDYEAEKDVFPFPIICKLQLGYDPKTRLIAMIKKIEVVDGKDTDLNIDKPVYAIHLANIEELRKRNTELIALINAERERQEKCDDVHLRKIAEFEKENAELKEVHESDKRSLALIAKKGADFEKAYNEAEELLDKQIEATYKLFEENKELKRQVEQKQHLADVRLEQSLENYKLFSDERKARIDVDIALGDTTDKLTYAKTIIQDLLDNTDEYARQRAEDFLKENK